MPPRGRIAQAAAAVGVTLDATRAYRPVMKALAVADFAFTLTLLLAARRNNSVLVYASFAALGAAMIASSATIMETAVECTHPRDPEISTGLLFCGGNVLSIATTYVFQALLEQQRGRCLPLTAVFSGGAPVALFTAVTVLLCSALLLLYRGPYRRLQAELADASRLSPTD